MINVSSSKIPGLQFVILKLLQKSNQDTGTA